VDRVFEYSPRGGQSFVQKNAPPPSKKPLHGRSMKEVRGGEVFARGVFFFMVSVGFLGVLFRVIPPPGDWGPVPHPGTLG